MPQRGDGIGIEVTNTALRAVRLDHQAPGRVDAVADVAISDFTDDSAVYDAILRAMARLSGSGDARMLPVRLAWFPTDASLQRLNATGMTGPELNQLRHELADTVGVTSTMLVDVGARRWLLALRWDHSRAWRLQELTERAGMPDVTVEPAPVALQRVLHVDASVARRDAAQGHSWVVVFENGTPTAAASVDPGTRNSPGLSTGVGSSQSLLRDEFETPMSAGDLAVAVGEIAAEAFALDTQADELELNLSVGGAPYPPFPAHDPQAPQRVAVALGAAVGAAGLAGRLRPVDALTHTRNSPDEMPRPWAVERLPERSLDMPPPVSASTPKRRLLRRR